MKRMIVEPEGWQTTFAECRPGFFLHENYLCMKSEYGQDAYVESGEFFWGGAKSHEERAILFVQPVSYRWEEYEE